MDSDECQCVQTSAIQSEILTPSITERKALAEKLIGLPVFIPPVLNNGNSNIVPNKTRSVIADGNCLFRAVAIIITGSEKMHKIIRDLVIEHMKSGCARKLEGYLSEPVADYIKRTKMADTMTWATWTINGGCASIQGES